MKESAMLDGLVEVMYPHHPEPAWKSIVTETTGYKNCEFSDSVNLPFLDDSALKNFDSEMQQFSLKPLIRMRDFIDRFFVDEDSGKELKRKHLIRQIMGLLMADDSVKQRDEFFLVTEKRTVHKEELCSMTELSLAAFLLAVWHFIVMHRQDNTVGQDTIALWFPNGYTGSLQIADKALGNPITQDFRFTDDSSIVLPAEPEKDPADKVEEDAEDAAEFADATKPDHEQPDGKNTGTEAENAPPVAGSRNATQQNYYGPAMTFNFNAPVSGFVAHADEVNNYFGEEKRGRKERTDE